MQSQARIAVTIIVSGIILSICIFIVVLLLALFYYKTIQLYDAAPPPLIMPFLTKLSSKLPFGRSCGPTTINLAFALFILSNIVVTNLSGFVASKLSRCEDADSQTKDGKCNKHIWIPYGMFAVTSAIIWVFCFCTYILSSANPKGSRYSLVKHAFGIMVISIIILSAPFIAGWKSDGAFWEHAQPGTSKFIYATLAFGHCNMAWAFVILLLTMILDLTPRPAPEPIPEEIDLQPIIRRASAEENDLQPVVRPASVESAHVGDVSMAA
ncbi:hypothetical protein EDB81DRAFT_935370 [Dactylonectria macrodidyma]|uniref:Uncharacterized protein n=1 Tax=Dactylonectria macrodidyma TaxID=307937 RepID=A0A9P9J2J9_9HYPO|nr:hypothetical protein EDB81DRAFT_935370 [Dactylonectria macrodidyma]